MKLDPGVWVVDDVVIQFYTIYTYTYVALPILQVPLGQKLNIIQWQSEHHVKLKKLHEKPLKLHGKI